MEEINATFPINATPVKWSRGECINSTQLCQQLIDGLNDVHFEWGEMLSEVFLTESSRGQQLVKRFLLVCFFTATSRSDEQNRAKKREGKCKETR